MTVPTNDLLTGAMDGLKLLLSVCPTWQALTWVAPVEVFDPGDPLESEPPTMAEVQAVALNQIFLYEEPNSPFLRRPFALLLGNDRKFQRTAYDVFEQTGRVLVGIEVEYDRDAGLPFSMRQFEGQMGSLISDIFDWQGKEVPLGDYALTGPTLSVLSIEDVEIEVCKRPVQKRGVKDAWDDFLLATMAVRWR